MKQWCWDCKNAAIYPGHNGFGDEPPVCDEAVCLLNDIDFESLDLAFDTAVKLGADLTFPENGFYGAHCGHFDPKMFEKCECCGIEMNVPQHSWEITWTPMYGMDVEPCCSQKCKEELIEKEREKYKFLEESN
ncbi:hypothetical protein D3C81_333510 [compost metagenome]